MGLLKLFLGLFALACLGVLFFMAVVFSAPGQESTPGLSRFLDASILFSIGICVLATVLLVLGYAFHWTYVYSWIFLPVPFMALFVVLRLVWRW